MAAACLLLPVLLGLVLCVNWLIHLRRGDMDIALGQWILALAALVVMVLLAPMGGCAARFLPAARGQSGMLAVFAAVLILGVQMLKFLWEHLPFGDLDQVRGLGL